MISGINDRMAIEVLTAPAEREGCQAESVGVVRPADRRRWSRTRPGRLCLTGRSDQSSRNRVRTEGRPEAAPTALTRTRPSPMRAEGSRAQRREEAEPP